MTANDIDLKAMFRVPSRAFDEAGRFLGSRWILRTVPAVLRAVPREALEPFPEGAPEPLRHYARHAGRAWLPMPRCLAADRPWEALRFDDPCELVPALSAFEGTPQWVGFAALGRTPFSVRKAREAPHRVPARSSPADEALLPRAAARVLELFERDLVHDGRRVWLAADPPLLHAPARQGRGSRAVLSPPGAVPPHRGPSTHAAGARAYLDVASRHRTIVRRAEAVSACDALAEACDRVGIADARRDVEEFVCDLPGTALQWASYAILRRGADLPPPNRLEALLPLAEAGLLSREERHEALDLGIGMARAVLANAPALRNWRHLAWVADHAEALVRPLLLAERTIPDGDAEALGALAR